MHLYDIPFAAVSCVVNTAKTVVSVITPATRRCRVLTIEIGAQSVAQTDLSMLLELVRFTADGTGSAATPQPWDQANPAALCTAKTAYTVEPTGPTVVWNNKLSPIGATLIKEFPVSREMYSNVSLLIGFRITALTSNQTVSGVLSYEE